MLPWLSSHGSLGLCRDWRDNLWDEPQPEPSAQRPSADIQPLDDEVGDAWATVNDELDEMPNLAPEPALKDEKEDSDLLSTEDSSSAETDLKARPTPRPRVGSIGADAWLPRRGDMAQRGAAQRSTVRPLQRDAGAPRRAGWTTSGDKLSGGSSALLFMLSPYTLCKIPNRSHVRTSTSL